MFSDTNFSFFKEIADFFQFQNPRKPASALRKSGIKSWYKSGIKLV